MTLRIARLLLACTLLLLLLHGYKGEKTPGRSVRRAEWGEWGEWTSCSRSCGTGISYRARECNMPPRKHKNRTTSHHKGRRSRRHLKSNCVGLYKQYRACNIQACPIGSMDFRQKQCEEYNSKSFRGRRYEWMAFTPGSGSKDQARNQCALSCQAKGYMFVSQLSPRVVDGTRCQDDDPHHLCVSGQCRRVGCDGKLDSNVRFDKCGVCGGDNTSCHIISGIFTRRSLPYGYNKVATIPKGACNINITEIMPNRNFLALKLTAGQYMINGNWVVGASKEYSAAGTTFRYYRPIPSQLQLKGQKEYIIGEGPTNQSVDIMLLKQQENHGIMYEYTIPMEPSAATSKTTKSTSERDRKPNWTKPEVKVKGPLPLTKADDPLKRPADEGMRPSAPKVFQPELSDRYQQQGTQTWNYLQGRPGPSSSYTPQRTSGAGIVDVSRPAAGKGVALQPAAASTNLHHNKANGHRLRHRGRHGGRHHRKVISAVRPTAVKQYDYQAQSLGPVQTSSNTYPANSGPNGGYVYPPVAGVVPQRPIPAVQSASRLHRGGVYQQQRSKYPATYGGSQYPHVIPATKQQYPAPGGGGGQPQHRYDNIYYPGGQAQPDQRQGRGQRQGQGQAKWALNDQIALSLPGAQYPLQGQIGNLDGGSDFTWRISGFTECSRTCGGGTQTTIIVCVKGASQAVVTDENCDNALKPESQAVSCNTRLCPPAWEPTEWSSCSTSCGRGTQTRDAACSQVVSEKDIRPVSAVLCQDLPKPDTVRICNEEKPCVRWKIGDWAKCSASCGRGQRTREVVCVNSEDRPIAENKCQGTRPINVEICDMGSCAKTWFYTQWSDECSTSCGEGVHIRKLHCSADADRCSVIQKPEDKKVCRNRLPCGGQWFTGPWQRCSVTCGHGVTRREVMCMKRLGRMMPVDEENCLSAEKPVSERPCENPACGPQWYMTDWTQCTKTCDTGYTQRDAKCLDSKQRVTTRCPDDDKPDVWKTCNTSPCPTSSPGQGDQDASCRDEYNNCRLVVQARLCHYAYYKKACCLSCAGSQDDNHHEGHHDNHHSDGDNKSKKQAQQADRESRDRRRQT